MSIPLLQRTKVAEDCWSALDAHEKRARLLRAAGDVFAREGLQAPMPAVAAAAGAGVGSVYRQFPSKRDLLAALVVERLQETERGAEAAAELGLRQRGRRCQRAPATEEIAPIAARTPLCALDVEERDAITEVGVVGIACE